jgi:Tol biopolymer transport system component
VFPEWSPVDDRIVFQRSRQRGGRWYSIWIMTMTGGEPKYPTEVAYSADFALILPAWSRDGSQIAYTTVASIPDIDPEFGQAYQTSDIWMINVDGGTPVRLTDAHTVNFDPAWAPNGRVFFASGRSGNETIWSIMPTISGDATTPMEGTDHAPHVTTTADRAHDGS